jgi:dTDP-4-dehydrorhamnose reductase
MNIVVTGHLGMLGKDVTRVLSEHDEVHTYDIRDKEQNDIRDESRVMNFAERTGPEIVIHLAAKTDVDRCEIETDDAFLTNAIGTKNWALASQNVGAEMVYVSTGSVFDGTKLEPYTEFDSPNPQSIYSKSKFEGEKMVERYLDRFYIVRTGWLFGGGKEDKKFVAKILDIAHTKHEISAVTDKIGSPTYTLDLANGIKDLIKTKSYGLYHVVNNGFCTRFDCAKKIVEYSKIENVTLKPVTSASFPLPAPRPRMEALRNYHLDLVRRNTMRNWEEALKDYVAWLMKRDEDSTVKL